MNSKRGVQFRQWATRLLKEHLTRGYTLNRERFEANACEAPRTGFPHGSMGTIKIRSRPRHATALPPAQVGPTARHSP
ncbi:hypothetical protein GCM10027514_25920 [Azotobacter armeniacus]